MNEQPQMNLDEPEWLAAYVDGELEPSARLHVDRRLEEDLQAREEVLDQRALSPENREFWDTVAPPSPSAEDWGQVFQAIAVAVMPPPCRYRPMRYLAPIIALTGIAAGILVMLPTFDVPPPEVLKVAPHDLAENGQPVTQIDEDFVFRVATADEVELIQLPEAAAGLIVVGRHPMAGVPFELALATDVQLLNYGPDDQGNLPDIETTQGPDASMLWAPTAFKP